MAKRLCQSCGQKISFLGSLSGNDVCAACQERIDQEERRRVEERRRLLAQELAPIAAGPIEAARAYGHLVEADVGSEFADKESEIAKVEAMKALMEKSAFDGGFGSWQIWFLGKIGDALNMTETYEVQGESHSRWRDESLVALQAVHQIRGGWAVLGSVPEGIALAHPSEGLYWGCPADCFREKVITEIQLEGVGGEVEISDRLSVEKSQIRGREIEVGRQWTLEDSGVVYATNFRVLFIGKRSSWSIDLDELIGIKVFSDGVRLLTRADDAEPLVASSNPNHQAVLVAGIEQGLKARRGTETRIGLDGIPDFSEADPETEVLLDELASKRGWSEQEIRFRRMLAAFEWDQQTELRGLLDES